MANDVFFSNSDEFIYLESVKMQKCDSYLELLFEKITCLVNNNYSNSPLKLS